MTPLLTGVFASQISGHLTPPFTPTGSYDAITSYTVPSGGVASVTFSGIPAGYKHLQLRILAATDRPTYAIDNMFTNLNGDYANNYAWHALEANVNGGTTAASSAPYDKLLTGTLSTGAAANVFTSTIVDILDYNNTSKFKTVRSLSGYDINGIISGYRGTVQMFSSLWRSNNAVTSISFARQSGSNFLQHSQFALYGVKG